MCYISRDLRFEGNVAFTGRISPQNMLVVIPAHFLGSIVGIVAFKTLIPIMPSVVSAILYPIWYLIWSTSNFKINIVICFGTYLQVFHPIVYNTFTLNSGLIIEAVMVFLYVVVMLVLPELIEVNKLNSKLLSIVLLPVMFFRNNSNWCSFNPAVIYALWSVNRGSQAAAALPMEHISAQVLGAVSAGLFCNYMFPDCPTTWKRGSASTWMNELQIFIW